MNQMRQDLFSKLDEIYLPYKRARSITLNPEYRAEASQIPQQRGQTGIIEFTEHAANNFDDKEGVRAALGRCAATFEGSQNKYVYGPSEIVDLMQSYYKVSFHSENPCRCILNPDSLHSGHSLTT